MGTERKDVAGKGSWHIPKFHAMLHSASSILLMGPWSNCEAQVIENNHVYMKRLAELTNQRVDQWELQILIHVARTEEAGNACNHETTALGDMKNNPLCAHEHASGSCATHITLSKSNLVAGIRSNIWEYMIAWKTCRHSLVYPAQRTDARTNGGVYICMSDLVTPAQSSGARSEWIRYCRDMLHLPLPRRVHPGYLPSQYCNSTSSHRRPSIILISPRSVSRAALPGAGSRHQ